MERSPAPEERVETRRYLLSIIERRYINDEDNEDKAVGLLRY